jgi:hypothetical protein
MPTMSTISTAPAAVRAAQVLPFDRHAAAR